MSEDRFKLSPLLEEISIDEGYDLSDDDDESLDTHIIDKETSNVKKGFQLSFSQSAACTLYNTAGTEETEVNSDMTVFPSPHALSTEEEQLIFKVKEDLGVKHDLDSFQVQSLVALQHGENVVLVSPCGSGKLLVFYMAVKLLRLKFNLPNGIGVCLQPLNNILWEV